VREQAVGQLFHVGGTARAGPAGIGQPHHVLHDQLAAAVEQLEQPDRPVRAVELVGLVHQHHRQPAPVGVEFVDRAGHRLLASEQFGARGQPFRPAHDLRKVHRGPPEIRSDVRAHDGVRSG
jgi:hypothetical protein